MYINIIIIVYYIILYYIILYYTILYYIILVQFCVGFSWVKFQIVINAL